MKKDIFKIIEALEKKGLDKYASKIKEAFPNYVSPSYGKVFPKATPQSVTPSSLNQPELKPGDTYTEIGKDIDPKQNIRRVYTGPESLIPLNTLSMDKLVDLYNSGKLSPTEINIREIERRINDIKNNPASTPFDKNNLKTLEDLLQKEVALRFRKCAGNILNLSMRLASLGDTNNARKLFKLIGSDAEFNNIKKYL